MSENLKDKMEKVNEILEVSVPIVKIFEGLIVASVIGTLDTERTQRIIENLLEKVVKEEARIVLFDITGVPTVDSRTAQHLIDTASAIRLLGSEVIITGINPTIAQTLVHIGIALSDIKTARSLALGVEMSLEILNKKIVSKDSE